MTKLLVVVGAMGSQGRAVIDWFQKNETSWRLRGLTRNPDSEAAQAMAAKGVEIVQADLEDPPSVEMAFEGATAIFAYTVHNALVSSPAAKQLVESGRVKNIAGACYELALRQSVTIADAAAKVSGLERLVFSSLSNVTKWSKGKYTHVYNFDCKAKAAEYMRQKEGLKDRVAFVQMGSFANNMVHEPANFGFFKQSDGSFKMSLDTSLDVQIPWVDVERDTGGFVNALIEAPPGTEMAGVSEWLTQQEYLDLWSKHTGVSAKAEYTSMQSAVESDESGMMVGFFELLRYTDEFGYFGGDPAVIEPANFEKQLGISVSVSKISDHIARSDWSAVLNS